MDLEQRILNTIEKSGMIRPGDHVIAAVSGGADSVCLLLLLQRLAGQIPFRLSAAHLEHGIRGGESLADAAFVQALCERLEVALYVKHEDIPARAAREGCSLEEAGRAARYEFFTSLARKAGASRIAAAHHAQDQAETVLLNLTRGSGTGGLCGMAPVRPLAPDLTLIRPLLETARSEIEAYLRAHDQNWRTDRTNADPAYARNRIRLEVLPQLSAINERASEHIAQAADRVREAEDYLLRQTERAWEQCVLQSDGNLVLIDTEAFGREDPLIRKYVLRKAAARLGRAGYAKDLGALHLNALLAMAAGQGGRALELPGAIRAQLSGKTLRFAKAGAGNADGHEKMQTPVYMKEDGIYQFGGYSFEAAFGTYRKDCGPIPQNQYTKWISYDTMTDDICLRHRRPGDYLVINDRGGTKKLKDYLIDQKIPVSERDRIVVLAQGAHILWAVGLRISEKAKLRAPGSPMLSIVCTPAEKQEDGPGI